MPRINREDFSDALREAIGDPPVGACKTTDRNGGDMTDEERLRMHAKKKSTLGLFINMVIGTPVFLLALWAKYADECGKEFDRRMGHTAYLDEDSPKRS